MVEPIVVPRSEHNLSRRDIDPDALKVLYRLKDAHYIAYLVGGSVRDLLLGRQPKDFDVATSAHPYQVKRLFRNCWIIGRRFRLAHVKFGPKIIEVATFRRQVPPIGDESGNTADPTQPVVEAIAAANEENETRDLLIHHDNTFGTPEEDAFRRDFTVNALFYDIATFSIIDYVGGLQDLRDRVVRSIGDPEERFREDPVRMLRAVALAARLDFTLDPPVVDAIRSCRHEIARSAPARLLEEYFKILRMGVAESTFRSLADVGLLETMTPELNRGDHPELWQSLAALDHYRRQYSQIPDSLSNAVLLGTLLVPLGFSPRAYQPRMAGGLRQVPRLTLGLLPIPRRDIEHLRQILSLQPRLADPTVSPRAIASIMNRTAFSEAVTWLEVHGQAPEAAERWRALERQRAEERHPDERLERRGRRRRRRRFRPLTPQGN